MIEPFRQPRALGPGLLPMWMIAMTLAIGFLAMSLLSIATSPVTAANVGVAPPLVEQCNDSGATAGQEIRCTIAVVNYLNANGTLAPTPASTVAVSVCVGPAGAPICGPMTVSTSLVPVTTARQCNAALYGGGASVKCTVTITNHWATGPALSPASIFQCVGSPITGPGAPGSCTPIAAANTAASTPAATVGQCNGSGYGGGTPVGGFNCTVAASTTAALLPIHVDQCNGSGYGGGGTVICSSAVMNDVIVPASSGGSGGSSGSTPPAGIPGEFPHTHPNGVDVVVPVVPASGATPQVVLVTVPQGVVPPPPAAAIVVAPVVIPVEVAQIILPPVVVPAGVVQVLVPVVVPPGIVPTVVTQLAPRPAATGNGGLTNEPSAEPPAWAIALLMLGTVAFTLGSRKVAGMHGQQ